MGRKAAVFLGVALLLTFAIPADTSADMPPSIKLSANVARILADAQELAATGNYKAALAKVDQAKAVQATPEDTAFIKDTRKFYEHQIAHPPVQPRSN